VAVTAEGLADQAFSDEELAILAAAARTGEIVNRPLSLRVKPFSANG